MSLNGAVHHRPIADRITDVEYALEDLRPRIHDTETDVHELRREFGEYRQTQDRRAVETLAALGQIRADMQQHRAEFGRVQGVGGIAKRTGVAATIALIIGSGLYLAAEQWWGNKLLTITLSPRE